MAARCGWTPIDPLPVPCSAPRCKRLATIVHDLKPYCGAHALKRLEAASRANAQPAAKRPNRKRRNQRSLNDGASKAGSFGKAQDRKAGPDQGA